ncbi:peptidoglycan-binding protein [Kovacikia minuta CCNUW1]|uniref:peptidoglycan-binding domain-containing protein n=1 Tax=Kovacikia minuta TaxID=2931930 RepID=UPI001CCDF813|nr:peptidoglycan-binding protein [Kovacikia minuta]UBF28217.1 peptidoglycan-binding protein [Kovacikia minuta CCNUW1]
MNTNSEFLRGMTEAALSGPSLYPWDKRPAVAELQELLNAHGFKLRIDGDFGYITEDAVKEFQRQQNIRIDGIVGPQTWAALKKNIPPGTRTLRHGHTGADVCELQGLLQVCGYPVGRHGIFDEETKQAVVAFQQHHKLKECGTVDKVTWTVLRDGMPLPPSPQRSRWHLNTKKWW